MPRSRLPRLRYCLHHALELTELRSYLGKRVPSSAKRIKAGKKPEPEYRGHTSWTKSAVNKRRASSSNNYARARARTRVF